MKPNWFYRALCYIGLHRWCYDHQEVDAVRRPIYRACLRCGTREERAYNGHDYGAYGGWEKRR